jgi:hypothetical protein
MNNYDRDDMPDFDSLDDRFILGPANGPIISLKTNLDAKDPDHYNPYHPLTGDHEDESKELH